MLATPFRRFARTSLNYVQAKHYYKGIAIMSLEIINPAYLSSLVDTALPLIQTGAPVVASLVILEGLLSVDNALVLAAMVKHLPEKQSKLALKAGLLGAYVGRGAMLLCASFILRNPWLKLLGGGYLVWLMVSNLGKAEEGEGEDEVKSSKGGFWQTVLAVELADLAFSVDNVAAAVAMSDQLWAVLTGVAIGILAMRFVAGIFVNLIHKYPILEQIAYLLVGWIGILLIMEEQGIYSADEVSKFVSILGIIGGGLAYSKYPLVAKALDPVVNYIGVQFGNVYELTSDTLNIRLATTKPGQYVLEIGSDIVELAAGTVKPITDLFQAKEDASTPAELPQSDGEKVEVIEVKAEVTEQ
ncbi:MAG: TerC family protein [Candidatus Obscuribacter sp.]|nr:TerC family protein [Candidatus Obscuribacter sp.]